MAEVVRDFWAAMPATEASRRPQSQSAVDRAEATRETTLAPAVVPVTKAQQAAGPLVEFSTISGEDPNENVNFGDVPAHCKCVHCDRSVVTFLDYEASWVTYLLAFVVWVSLGWMAFWVLPLLWPAFKDVVHRCPRCLNAIERKSRINLPTCKSEVMTVKVGNCAVLLSRKYLAILLGVIGLIVSFYLLRSTIQMHTAHEEHKGMPSMLTWDDFLFDCGPRTSQLSHRPSSAKSFEERYRRRSFKWQGEVRLIREGFDVFFVKTKSVAMVQMFPPRYKTRRGDHPDVALLFGEEHFAEVSELMPGDWVEFEATMSAHGYRGDPEIMVLWRISKKERPNPPSSSAGAESPEHHGDEPDVEAKHSTHTASEGAAEASKGAADSPPSPEAHTQDGAGGGAQLAVAAEASAKPDAPSQPPTEPALHE